jgi:hypothetical protein
VFRRRHVGAKLRLLLRNRQQAAAHTWHLHARAKHFYFWA